MFISLVFFYSPSAAAIPMSAQTSSPQRGADGSAKWSGFVQSNVTVASACTAPGAVSPVSAFTPLGRSSASTNAPRYRSSFMSAHAAAPDGRSAPWNPVPYSASTTASALNRTSSGS